MPFADNGSTVFGYISIDALCSDVTQLQPMRDFLHMSVIIRMNQKTQRPADHFFTRIPEDLLSSRVPVCVSTFRIKENVGNRHSINMELQPGQQFIASLFGLQAFGDIQSHQQTTLASLVGQIVTGDFNGKYGAVFTLMPPRGRCRCATRMPGNGSLESWDFFSRSNVSDTHGEKLFA